MKWELKDRHSKSPRAYQVVSQAPQIATQRSSNGVVSPIANNYSNADVACIDQMSLGVHAGTGAVGPPSPWHKLKPQQHSRRPTTLRLDLSGPQKPEHLPRPQTATLERPRVLDIALIGKIDMSLTRKALLSISNLCVGSAVDAAKRNGASPRDGRGGKTRRFAGVAAATGAARRGRPGAGRPAGGGEDEDGGGGSSGASSSPTPATPSRRQPAKKQQQLKAPAVRRRPEGDAAEARAGVASGAAVPQPCTTCGRPEQPERLHSHPAARTHQAQQPQQQQQQLPQPPKSSVRKPVPMNFRSSASTAQLQQQQQPPPPLQQPAAPEVSAPRAAGRPRTVVCYLCGREFGTKSYPLHEPHCLQKWHRENSSLPAHLQREPPKRPDQPLTTRQWNQQAWDAAQASLVPCDGCGRTFNPDRLEVHRRSCRVNPPPPPPTQPQKRSPQAQTPPDGEPEASSAAASAAASRVGLACRWCGRLFGSASLRIHEAQCARRAEAASPSPPSAATPGASPEHRPRKPRMLLCYLCGRGFSQASLHIHEAQCLKRWRHENERLPPAQRRAEPERPALVLTESGALDLDATVEAAWQSHLQQLVPCEGCGRTFYPDRLEVHQRSCKGRR